MRERQRQTPDRFETEMFPQTDGARVGGDHEVELHGPKAAGARVLQRVLAHAAGHAAPRGIARGHVAAVRHVRAAARLIGAQIICAEQPSAVLGDEARLAEVLEEEAYRMLPGFYKRMSWFLKHRTDLSRHISYCETGMKHGHRLLAKSSGHKKKREEGEAYSSAGWTISARAA